MAKVGLRGPANRRESVWLRRRGWLTSSDGTWESENNTYKVHSTVWGTKTQKTHTKNSYLPVIPPPGCLLTHILVYRARVTRRQALHTFTTHMYPISKPKCMIWRCCVFRSWLNMHELPKTVSPTEEGRFVSKAPEGWHSFAAGFGAQVSSFFL